MGIRIGRQDVVCEIDLQRRTMIVDPPEGL
jgi:hypothetical protein